MGPKIKWWNLKEEKVRVMFKERLLESVKLHADIQGWWTENSKNDEVQERIKTKKEAKKKADISGQEQDKENYKQAKKEARRTVTKTETLNEVYKEMYATEVEKKISRIAKARDAASKDLTQIRQIKDSNGIVLEEENEIKRRWQTYFEGLLNEESQRTVFEIGLPNEAVTI
ncbi:uncharacterized protein [Palaemon carinicauda]|uniref:uncharacterized protein n=1 Tax=Palaemon carinicauda TaxID=392227 RepID=UPI0035B67D3F